MASRRERLARSRARQGVRVAVREEIDHHVVVYESGYRTVDGRKEACLWVARCRCDWMGEEQPSAIQADVEGIQHKEESQ